jgi:putative membrane protein
MAGFLGEAYLWVKALHVIAVIAWMAGMLYLPRLYVYHAAAEPGSPQSETFKVMERRLLRAIINPAMIASWVLGLKLALLLGMQLVHAAYARWRREFARDARRHGATLYRVANEVPTLLMIGIVILVIVKPF